ncbi:hypothetical protein CYMTET_19430 [Cymbomonas tetramitiformis]|uniref:Magnesium transporter MgtE intracellular domain-containing protein n=1 Tax=Cymbomonas tetramitiformis TaxID=36881 RepID=A0AAE0G628_9CHLO|nr:hypothetical protein CYMTET_19430 [Cymbomonas tetramitiformis]
MKLRAAGHEVDSVKKDLERERTNGQAKAQKMARILAKSLEHINSLPPPADPTPYMSQLSEGAALKTARKLHVLISDSSCSLLTTFLLLCCHAVAVLPPRCLLVACLIAIWPPSGGSPAYLPPCRLPTSPPRRLAASLPPRLPASRGSVPLAASPSAKPAMGLAAFLSIRAELVRKGKESPNQAKFLGLVRVQFDPASGSATPGLSSKIRVSGSTNFSCHCTYGHNVQARVHDPPFSHDDTVVTVCAVATEIRGTADPDLAAEPRRRRAGGRVKLYPNKSQNAFHIHWEDDELNEVMVHLDPVVATEMMKRFDVAISVGIIAQTAREQASALNSMDASHAAGILMQMDAAVRAMALASMDPGHVASMLDQLPMEDMVAFLNDLSLEKTTELLQAMDPNRHASPLPVVLACLPSPFPWPAPAPPPPPACVWPKRIRSTPSSL